MKWLIGAFIIVLYTFIVLWQVDVPVNQVSNNQDVGASNRIRSTREIQDKTTLLGPSELIKNFKANQRKVAAFKEAVNNSQTSLNDVFISLKTTKSFHHSRLSIILRTWFILARDQV